MRRTAVVASVALTLVLAGCATTGPTNRIEPSTPSRSAGSAAGAATPPATAAASEPASLAASPNPAETSSSPTVEGDSAELLRICYPGPPEPSDIDCKDAVDAALGVAGAGSLPFRAVLTWSTFCAFETPCPSQAPDPKTAYVVLHLADGTGVQVAVRLDNGALSPGPPAAITAHDIGPRQTFDAPPVAKADVAPAPALISNRRASPLCGMEQAGLAGPFDVRARNCFMTALLAGDAAEFVSRRADVGGAPFLELWRFEGSGPVTVFRGEAGSWSQLRCGVVIAAGDQLFDHTDCTSAPVR